QVVTRCTHAAFGRISRSEVIDCSEFKYVRTIMSGAALFRLEVLPALRELLGPRSIEILKRQAKLETDIRNCTSSIFNMCYGPYNVYETGSKPKSHLWWEENFA
ncbi:hypothetical protein PFISCL1PPCAC_8223, partial [Pristionchus fissidentatus]